MALPWCYSGGTLVTLRSRAQRRKVPTQIRYDLRCCLRDCRVRPALSGSSCRGAALTGDLENPQTV